MSVFSRSISSKFAVPKSEFLEFQNSQYAKVNILNPVYKTSLVQGQIVPVCTGTWFETAVRLFMGH